MPNEKTVGLWPLFKWGARNHPGNYAYVLIVVMCYLAAILNKNILSGLVAATVVTILLGVMYIITSISVGKANRRLVEEEADHA